MFKKKDLTRLGDILVSKGLISSAQLDIAIQEQHKRKKLLDPSVAAVQVTPLGEILIELGFIDRLQLKRGLNWQQHLRRASIAMALCAPFMIFSPSAAAAVRVSPITIEAENYTSMSGVVNETTTDIGGGKNTGSINSGDWISYDNVVIAATGTYTITYRVASLSAGGSFVVKDAQTNTTLDTVIVPVTGGWQSWVDVKTTVKLTKGTVNLKLIASQGAFNLNWFRIEPVASSTSVVTSSSAASSTAVSSATLVSSAAVSSAPASSTPVSSATASSTPTSAPFSLVIQAENYSAMSGVYNESTTDVGGGLDTGNINTGDWMTYNNVVIPTTGTYTMTYRVASLSSGGTFVLRDASTNATLDTVTVPATGGWQTWVDVKTTVTLPAGTVNLKLLATLGGFNVNWFKIESSGTVVASSSSAPASSAPASSSPASSAPASSIAASSTPTSSTPTVSSAASSSVASSTGIFPFVIQAENYAAMSGVYNETTTDIGGGKDVGNINTGDWMSYTNTKVTLPFTGRYKITYRVASLNGGGSLALQEAGTTTTHNLVAIPATGGWQNWIDVVAEVDMSQGDHYFTIFGKIGGFNVNWFKIEPIGTPMPLTIEAENYSAMSGIYNETTTDIGGGKDAGNINTGDWMDYANVEVLIPETANYKVTYRVASLSAGGKFTLHEAGTTTIFDTVTVPVTGGWQNWASVEKIVTLPAGKHYFGMKALLGGFNLNWIKFEKVDANGNVISSSSSAGTSSGVVSSSVSSVPASSVSSSSVPAVSSSSSSWSSSSAGSTGTYHLAGPVGISWTAPTMRENGVYLDITELGGYEIRYKKSTDTKYTYVSIADAWTMRYDFPSLPEGDYVFQIAAFDKNGVYSPFVDIQRL